jgi:hypothetical protein
MTWSLLDQRLRFENSKSTVLTVTLDRKPLSCALRSYDRFAWP